MDDFFSAETPQPCSSREADGAEPGSAVMAPVEGRASPGQGKSLRTAQHRRAAAEWVRELTGAAVPHDSDRAFRAALTDGVILVHLLNALRPGAVARVVERDATSPTGAYIRAFENVSNFLEAAKQFTAESFSAADLEDDADRPHVVDCLLSLRDWQRGPGSAPTSARRDSAGPSAGTPVTPAAPAPPPPSPAALPAAHSFTPQAAALAGRPAASADGINYLMRSCTHMLKSRMGVPATPLPPPPAAAAGAAPPEVAFDAVGPILESVLSSLTTEYERRLAAKDQEARAQADAGRALRRQVDALRAEAAQWRARAEGAAAAAAAEASSQVEALKAQERAEYERLVESEAALLCEVSCKRRELAAVEADGAQRRAAAEAELASLRSQLADAGELQAAHKALQAENRALYNTVQDLRGSIRVFCRVRPRGATGDATAAVVEPGGEEGALCCYSHKHAKWHDFKFDRVFGEASEQEQIYDETKPLIRSVLDGFNVCIFAYGQTGSGKTHTMSGDAGGGRGINHRAFEDLFAQAEQRHGEVEYTVTLQLLEIYNETIRDLLVPEAEAREERSLALSATLGSGRNVAGAAQLRVACAAEVGAAMARGARNRAVAETKMNERSSRSHQVLTVLVEGLHLATHARSRGCLHLIDLAGSERVGRSGAEGRQLVEAQHINRSLSALGGVMAALAQKRDHVPYRDSKLTQLLQDSLGGAAKSMMFVHVAPEMSSAAETLSTLNFGQSVTEITLGAAKRNSDTGALGEARDRAARAERQAAAAVAALQEESARGRALEAEAAELRRRLEAARAGDGAAIPAFRPAAEAGMPRPMQVARLNLSKISGGLGTPQRGSPAGSPRAAGGSKIPTPCTADALQRTSSLEARQPAGGEEPRASLAAAAAHSMLPRARPAPGAPGGAPLSARGTSSASNPGSGASTGRRWA